MTIDRRTLLTATLALGGTSMLPVRAQATGQLTAYASEAQMREALERWRERSQQRSGERRRAEAPAIAQDSAAGALAKSAPAAPAATAAESSTSITNVQTAGVDEGGIVKRAGDFLVVLRRGRLFTVRVGGDALAPVSAVDAYAPGSNPQGA